MSEKARRTLYPPIEPDASGRLPVSGGHAIYWEEIGAADGLPAIALHGGPGGGASADMRRFFDPARWRVCLFDQRGCGRSLPFSGLEANTTWDLVADMEALRERAGVERWAVFGGSWGSTLALAYAVTHPERVSALILRGIFFHTQGELDWLYKDGGANRFYPDAWARFLRPLSQAERAEPLAAFHKRVNSGDPDVRREAAFAWSQWEGDLLCLAGPDTRPDSFEEDEFADAFARIETHYFLNGGFFEHDGWLIDQLPVIAHIPAAIVNGRYDVITPPAMAARLHAALPGSTLEYVQDAGHASSEPGIVDALVRATDAMAARLTP